MSKHFQYDSVKVHCPCEKCCNGYKMLQSEVQLYILENGIMPTYTTWYLHGEKEDFDIECEIDEEEVIG